MSHVTLPAARGLRAHPRITAAIAAALIAVVVTIIVVMSQIQRVDPNNEFYQEGYSLGQTVTSYDRADLDRQCGSGAMYLMMKYGPSDDDMWQYARDCETGWQESRILELPS